MSYSCVLSSFISNQNKPSMWRKLIFRQLTFGEHTHRTKLRLPSVVREKPSSSTFNSAFNRNFTTTSIALSPSNTPRQSREKRINIIMTTVIMLFLLSTIYLNYVGEKSHDIVYIDSEEQK